MGTALTKLCSDDENRPPADRNIMSSSRVMQTKSQFGEDPMKLECYDVKPYKSPIPAVLCDLKVRLIKCNGLNVPDIFYNSSFNDDAAKKSGLDGDHLSFCKDPHIIAYFIKVWFRDLPMRLFHDVALTKLGNTKAKDQIPNFMNYLLPLQSAIFVWLLDLCAEVLENTADNNMTSEKLSHAFAPTLIPRCYDRDSNCLDEVITILDKAINIRVEWRAEVKAKQKNAGKSEAVPSTSTPLQAQASSRALSSALSTSVTNVFGTPSVSRMSSMSTMPSQTAEQKDQKAGV